MTDRGDFTGRCPLCGARTVDTYCYAHSWAAGVKSGSLPSRPAGHLELVAKPLEKPRRPSSSPDTIAVRLGNRKSREAAQ